MLGAIHEHDVDFADLYFQHARFESWSLEEGIVKSGTFSIDRGVGVRAVSGERAGVRVLGRHLAGRARRSRDRGARDRPPGTVGRRRRSAARGHARALYTAGRSGREPRRIATKVALLERLERMARARDPRVTQVMASLAGEHETVLIARSDGLIVADVRPLVRVSITVIVEENGRREQGYSGGGGRFDYAYFDDALLDAVRERRPSTRRCSTCRRATRRRAR